MKLDKLHTQVPIIMPIFAVVAAAYLVIGPIVDDPAIEFLYAFLGIVAGLLVYFPFVHY